MEDVLSLCRGTVESAVDFLLDVIGQAITFVAKALTGIAEKGKEKIRSRSWEKEKETLRPILKIVLIVSAAVTVITTVCCLLSRKK